MLECVAPLNRLVYRLYHIYNVTVQTREDLKDLLLEENELSFEYEIYDALCFFTLCHIHLKTFSFVTDSRHSKLTKRIFKGE